MCTHPAELRFLPCQFGWPWTTSRLAWVQLLFSHRRLQNNVCWDAEIVSNDCKEQAGVSLLRKNRWRLYQGFKWKSLILGNSVLEELPGHGEVTVLAVLPSICVPIEKLGYSHVVLGYSTALTQQDVRAQMREVSSFAVNDWCITSTSLRPCSIKASMWVNPLQPLLENPTNRGFITQLVMASATPVVLVHHCLWHYVALILWTVPGQLRLPGFSGKSCCLCMFAHTCTVLKK